MESAVPALVIISFPAARMAADAIVTEIVDLVVFILHLRWVMLMAAVTGIGAVVITGMAQLALLICALMVHREGVLEAGRFPGVGAVTLRALPAEVIVRAVARVTGQAVLCPSSTMIKAGRLPGIRAVAGRTLGAVMIGRFVRGVAGEAIAGILS